MGDSAGDCLGAAGQSELLEGEEGWLIGSPVSTSAPLRRRLRTTHALATLSRHHHQIVADPNVLLGADEGLGHVVALPCWGGTESRNEVDQAC